MKLDGMDATTKAVFAPFINIEQLPGKSGVLNVTTRKTNGEKEKADATGATGATGASIVKSRHDTDSQTFDRMFNRYGEYTPESINEAIERANRVILGSDRRFEISIHEKIGIIMVKVLDTRTNETIREIPPKKIVDLVVSLCEIAGILFDEKG